MRTIPVLTFMVSGLAGCASRVNPAVAPTPGFNLFSPQQDIQLGQEAAAKVRQEYQVVPNPWLQNYIRRVSNRLASQPQARASGFPLISHAILRHGTNQVSKAEVIQLPAALAGAALGGSALGQLVARELPPPPSKQPQP